MTAKARKESAAGADERESRFGLGWAALLYFGLALVYFIPAFLPGNHIYGTDYLAGGYFFQEFISQRLHAGVLPKWVPYVYGGLPLFSNPGSAFYPFRFLADGLFGVTRILPTIFVIQAGFAGLGTWLLARELDVRSWIAAVVGLAFEFTGLTMSFVYAGQDGRIIVATFTPLLFYFLHRGIRTGRLGPFVGAAATVGFTLLSFQIQTAYYMLLAAGAWAVFCLVVLGYAKRPGALGKRVGFGLGAVAVGFALAAVNFLPFLGYVPASPRGGTEGRGYEYSTSYSMPPEEIVGLAVPEQYGVNVTDLQRRPEFPVYHGRSPFKLHTEYAGALVVALLFLGAFYSFRNRYWWFFAVLTAFALSMAFGGYTPIFRLYYELLPGAKKFRAPNLSFFLVSFSLALMAALTLERLARLRAERVAARRPSAGPADELRWLPWVLGALLALSVAGVALSSGQPATPGVPTRAGGWLRFAVFLAATSGTLWLWIAGTLSPRVAAVVLAVITLLDLWIIDRRFFQTIPPPEMTFAADDVVDFLRSQQEPFRVWSVPSPPLPGNATYGRQGDYLMHFRIDQAGGEHGNQLQSYNDLIGSTQENYVDWHNFLQHPALMDVANVRYLALGAKLNAPGLKLVHEGPAGVVYENIAAQPRAWMVDSVAVVPGDQADLDAMKAPDWDPARVAYLREAPPQSAGDLGGGPLRSAVHVTAYTPDSVTLHTQADRGALLVLADNFYPGWKASVDGADVPVLRADHTFRGVPVPAGGHEVVFRFEPQGLHEGFLISLAFFALVVAYGAFAGVEAVRQRTVRQPKTANG